MGGPRGPRSHGQVQRTLHACRLLLPAAGERRAAGAGWGAAGRGPGACGWGSVPGASARPGGSLESRSGRAEPAPAGRAVSLCALLAGAPGPRARPVRESPARPALGFHASGPLRVSGLLWDCGSQGLGVCPRPLSGSAEVPPCACLPMVRAHGSPVLRVSAGVRASHEVSAPLCLPGFFLGYLQISDHFWSMLICVCWDLRVQESFTPPLCWCCLPLPS